MTDKQNDSTSPINNIHEHDLLSFSVNTVLNETVSGTSFPEKSLNITLHYISYAVSKARTLTLHYRVLDDCT